MLNQITVLFPGNEAILKIEFCYRELYRVSLSSLNECIKEVDKHDQAHIHDILLEAK